MQNFSYIIAPFTDAEGKPLSGARVTFRELGTSGEKIDIYDFSGTTRIENPLILNSDGRLPKTPYIKDGVSYKVTIEKPTGVEPIYDGALCLNESECWEDPVVFNVASVNNAQAIDVSNVYVVGVAGVRNAPKALGAVIAKGYESADDGCPARLFRWVSSVESVTDNGFNILVNQEDNTGYWQLDIQGGVVDVRMGGLFSNSGTTDNAIILDRILNAISGTDNNVVYFPKGTYYFGGTINIASMILGDGAYIYPYSSTCSFNVGYLENRGGEFRSTSNKTMFRNIKSYVSKSGDIGASNVTATKVKAQKFDSYGIIFEYGQVKKDDKMMYGIQSYEADRADEDYFTKFDVHTDTFIDGELEANSFKNVKLKNDEGVVSLNLDGARYVRPACSDIGNLFTLDEFFTNCSVGDVVILEIKIFASGTNYHRVQFQRRTEAGGYYSFKTKGMCSLPFRCDGHVGNYCTFKPLFNTEVLAE